MFTCMDCWDVDFRCRYAVGCIHRSRPTCVTNSRNGAETAPVFRIIAFDCSCVPVGPSNINIVQFFLEDSLVSPQSVRSATSYTSLSLTNGFLFPSSAHSPVSTVLPSPKVVSIRLLSFRFECHLNSINCFLAGLSMRQRNLFYRERFVFQRCLLSGFYQFSVFSRPYPCHDCIAEVPDLIPK